MASKYHIVASDAKGYIPVWWEFSDYSMKKIFFNAFQSIELYFERILTMYSLFQSNAGFSNFFAWRSQEAYVPSIAKLKSLYLEAQRMAMLWFLTLEDCFHLKIFVNHL